jgi:PIN domain nuclease of toxin-antitoxin system
MRLLLDTHIWLWAYLEPHKLSSDVHRALTDPGNARFLSPVSIWEFIVLFEKKRITLRQDFGDWFEQSKATLQLGEAPLDWKIVHEMRFVMLGHKDPADRFLAATALAYDLTLVTADQRLLQVAGLKTIANI